MLDYSEIRVNLPILKIKKLNEHLGYLDDAYIPLLKQKLVEVDTAIARLQHAKSVMERILNKAW
jgi:hypothetical protein